jgi:hypothetical protein
MHRSSPSVRPSVPSSCGALVHPSPGESYPVVFRGTTQGVSASGDAVAFYPNERYTDVFHAFPGFAVVNTGQYALAWYACLTEGIVRT